MKKRAWISLTVFISAAMFCTNARSMIFSDGIFAPEEWEIIVVEVGLGGATSAVQVLDGGNPDEYRLVTCVVNEPVGE